MYERDGLDCESMMRSRGCGQILPRRGSPRDRARNHNPLVYVNTLRLPCSNGPSAQLLCTSKRRLSLISSHARLHTTYEHNGSYPRTRDGQEARAEQGAGSNNPPQRYSGHVDNRDCTSSYENNSFHKLRIIGSIHSVPYFLEFFPRPPPPAPSPPPYNPPSPDSRGRSLELAPLIFTSSLRPRSNHHIRSKLKPRHSAVTPDFFFFFPSSPIPVLPFSFH